MEPDRQLEATQLSAHWQAMRRQARLIVACALAFGVLGAVVSATGSTQYEARVDVQMHPDTVDRIFAGALAGTEAPVLIGKLESFVQTGTDISPGLEVKTEQGNNNVVTLMVRAATRQRALDEANAIAAAFIEADQGSGRTAAEAAQALLQERLVALDAQAATGPEVRAETVQERREVVMRALEELTLATHLARLGSPDLRGSARDAALLGRGGSGPVRTGLVAAMIGLLLGTGAAIVRNHYDTTIRTADDIRARFPTLPVMAEVPVRNRRGGRGQPAVLAAPDDPTSEGFRTLRAALQF
ncbi:MAG: hypothetical protein ACRDZ7_09545, partial [Acidimicrobiia bacterium]